MNKIEIKKAILKTVEQKVDQWLEEEPHITSGFEYETKILEIGRRVAKEIMIQSMGKLPASRNQKKTSNVSRPNWSKKRSSFRKEQVQVWH